MKPTGLVLLISFVVLFVVQPVVALDINPGDNVHLKATNPAGVPLHQESKSSMFDRLPDGSVVKVLQTTNTNWLQVSKDDLTGWIVKRYVDKVVPEPTGGGTTPAEERDSLDVWRSSDLCDSVVTGGARLQRATPETIRLVTWNIRWFPQGTLFGDDQDKFTDQAWLSCTLAWLNADVIAVEEILDHSEARSAMENVIDGLQGFSGGDWKIDLQECGSGHSQHVGFIYNADRVTLSGEKDMWQFNGKADDANDSPCSGNLRPGRYAYVKSNTPDGFDFHLIVVHTDSGVNDSDLVNRNKVLDRLDEVSASLVSTDADIVIIGDFNTMGTDTKTAEVELAEFATKVESESPGYSDIPIQPQCTEYFDHNGGWLDHVLVTDDTQEIANLSAHVNGYCKMANCDRLNDMPSAYDRLSDHCPVVIDFEDKDID